MATASNHQSEPVLTPSKLRAIRHMRGMSQAELAHRAGIAVVSIATFESGKSDMRASTIIKLCEALGVTVVYRLQDGTEITGP